LNPAGPGSTPPWPCYRAETRDNNVSRDLSRRVCEQLIKGKLLESKELVLQASNNTKAQFANSPTLSKEIMNAVMDALAAHTVMSKRPSIPRRCEKA